MTTQQKWIFLFFIFFYFWLHWVFTAAHGPSLVAASGGYCSLQCVGFSLQWLLLLWSMGSRCTGSPSRGTRAQQLWLAGSRAQAQQLWRMGLVAPRHVGSSRTRARTYVPCIGRWILNHCATREVLEMDFLKIKTGCKWAEQGSKSACYGAQGDYNIVTRIIIIRSFQIWVLPFLQFSPRVLFLIYCSDYILFIRNLQGFPTPPDLLFRTTQPRSRMICHILIFRCSPSIEDTQPEFQDSVLSLILSFLLGMLFSSSNLRHILLLLS